jgi:hypothetical protein
MRVSIWQQFSSNHSSQFTVVGKFKTIEDAARAAAAIEAMIRAAVEWIQQPENAEVLQQAETKGLFSATPPEREFAEKLGLDWGPSRYGEMFFKDWSYQVITLDNLLFVDGNESSRGAYPFDAVVAKLGGEVYVHGTLATKIVEVKRKADDAPRKYREETGDYASLTVSVSCVAPDDAAAARIETEYGDYQARMSASRGSPEWDLFSTPWEEFGGLSSTTGNLRREGARLFFIDLQIFHISEGFPAMIDYFRARGCTDIRYEFHEERF